MAKVADDQEIISSPDLNQSFWRGLRIFKKTSAALGFFLASCIILMQTPCVGVSDILDYWRVMRPAGIEHLEEPCYPGYYVQGRYRTGKADLISLPSSSAVLANCSRGLSFLFGAGRGSLDLRQIGLVYILLTTALIAAAGLAGLPVIELWLLAFIALDPAYLLFFNSFYADPSLFVALLGGYCWFRWNDIRMANRETSSLRAESAEISVLAFILLIALCILGGGSKMQYITFPVAVLFSLLILQIVRPAFRSPRVVFLDCAIAVVTLCLGWVFFFGPGPRFLKYNNYNAVFGGIAKVSSHPHESLARLGISEKFRDLPRTDIWSAGMTGKHTVHAELAKLSHFELARGYGTDPSALSSVLTRICAELSKTAGHPRGNQVRHPEDKSPTKRLFEYPLQYSKTLRKLYSGSVISFSLLFILSAVLPFFPGFRKFFTPVFLCAWISSQCIVVVLGEGFVNLHQHLIGARLGIDLLALNLVVNLVSTMTGHYKKLPVRKHL